VRDFDSSEEVTGAVEKKTGQKKVSGKNHGKEGGKHCSKRQRGDEAQIPGGKET